MDDNYRNGGIRVLQVMDKCAIRGSPIHGVSRLLLTWWPAFLETEFEFSLCVLRGGGTTCGAFNDIGVNVQDLGRSKIDPRTIMDLVKIIRRDNINILHCHGYGSTTFGRIAGAICRIPVLVHEHMIDNDIPFYQRIADFVLSPLTTKGIAVSEAVRDFMVGPRSINKKNMEVVYNSIPKKYCRTFSIDEKKAVAKKFKIPDDKLLIGIVGRLDPVKGHADFLEAAAYISESIADAYFVIVGDGELRTQLQELAQKLRIDKKVLFLGHCDDVIEIISLFDVYVSCSHFEGAGLAIVEAMALGKPIVATSVGGVPEIVSDGESGILVPAKKPQMIADAVIMVLHDKRLQEELGKNALKRCKEKFLDVNTVEQLGSIYKEVTCNASG